MAAQADSLDGRSDRIPLAAGALAVAAPPSTAPPSTTASSSGSEATLQRPGGGRFLRTGGVGASDGHGSGCRPGGRRPGRCRLRLTSAPAGGAAPSGSCGEARAGPVAGPQPRAGQRACCGGQFSAGAVGVAASSAVPRDRDPAGGGRMRRRRPRRARRSSSSSSSSSTTSSSSALAASGAAPTPRRHLGPWSRASPRRSPQAPATSAGAVSTAPSALTSPRLGPRRVRCAGDAGAPGVSQSWARLPMMRGPPLVTLPD